MGKKGGYKRQKPLYALKFEGDEFEGLEIMARTIPLSKFFELQRLQELASTDADAAEEVVRRLAGVLVSWNLLDDDDNPVPAEFAVCTASGKPGKPGNPCSAHQPAEGTEPESCEYTGLVAQDLPFVLAIVQAWMEAVTSVPNLSKSSSNGGETSLELSIPMDVSSLVPQS